MFNVPNPYGGYFDLGGPEAMAAATYGRFDPSTMSPGLQAAMGAPGGGGHAPTKQEAVDAQVRSQQYQQFMSYVYRTDPRASLITNAALDAMYRSDRSAQKQFLSRVGGFQGVNEVVSGLINTPGISRHLGGSLTSLGFGSLGIGTSGMIVNGRQQFGEGDASMAASQVVYDHIRSRFQTRSGAINQNAAGALNFDQIGGILATAGSQGAFSGMEVGKFQRAANGAGGWQTNMGTMKKIEDFTKNAAQAISTIIDIYGNSTFQELFQKAQRITGMDFSTAGAASAMRQRLGTLASAGATFGASPMEVMDLAAFTTDYGKRFGLSSSASGSFSQVATIQGLAQQRAWSGAANMGGVYFQAQSRQELAAGAMRDLVGMTMDPLGGRRVGLQRMIQNGMFKGADLEQATALMSNSNPSNYRDIDAFVQRSQGVSIQRYIEQNGGPKAMLDTLDESSRSQLALANSSDFNRRMETRMGRYMTRTLGFSEKLAGASIAALRNFNAGTLGSILGKLGSGDSDAFAGITASADDRRTVTDLHNMLKETGKGSAFQDFTVTMARDSHMSQYTSKETIGMTGHDMGGASMRFLKRGLLDDVVQKQLTKWGGGSHQGALFAAANMAQEHVAVIKGGLDRKNFMDGQGNMMSERLQELYGSLGAMKRHGGTSGELARQLEKVGGFSLLQPETSAGYRDGITALGRLIDSPEKRAKGLAGFEVFNLSEGQAFMKTGVVAKFQEAQLVSLQSVSEVIKADEAYRSKQGVYADNIMALASGKGLDINNLEGSRRRITDMLRRSVDDLSPETIGRIGKSDQAIGQDLLKQLEDANADINSKGAGNVESGFRKQRNIQSKIDALNAVGIRSTTGETVTKITGTLTLIGGDKAVLNASE